MSRPRLRLTRLEPRDVPAGGLTASYFAARDFASPAVTRRDAVDFDRAATGPTGPAGAAFGGT